MQSELKILRELAIDQAIELGQDPYGVHGVSHWEMVAGTAAILLEANGHNPTIGHVFGLLHDCQRHNDHHDPEHGIRAADFARTIREKIPLGNHDFDQLLDAMEIHNERRTAHGPTIVGCCCDGDRLDLGRVGITPDSQFLASPQAKQLVDDTHTIIKTNQGQLITLWHGSDKLENADDDNGLRIRPNSSSPIYLTEAPEVCEWYGPTYQVMLMCQNPADLCDTMGLIHTPTFRHVEKAAATLAKSLPDTFKESGEKFDLFFCLECGDIYHQLGRPLSEDLIREILAHGYDALRLNEDARSHHHDGEKIPSWVTFNKTNSIIKFPND